MKAERQIPSGQIQKAERRLPQPEALTLHAFRRPIDRLLPMGDVHDDRKPPAATVFLGKEHTTSPTTDNAPEKEESPEITVELPLPAGVLAMADIMAGVQGSDRVSFLVRAVREKIDRELTRRGRERIINQAAGKVTDTGEERTTNSETIRNTVSEYKTVREEMKEAPTRILRLSYEDRGLVVDDSKGEREILLKGNQIKMIMELFLKNPGKIVTTEDIRNLLDSIGSTSSANIAVQNLKQQLGDSGENPLISTPGKAVNVGYRLNVDQIEVHELEEQPTTHTTRREKLAQLQKEREARTAAKVVVMTPAGELLLTEQQGKALQLLQEGMTPEAIGQALSSPGTTYRTTAKQRGTTLVSTLASILRARDADVQIVKNPEGGTYRIQDNDRESQSVIEYHPLMEDDEEAFLENFGGLARRAMECMMRGDDVPTTLQTLWPDLTPQQALARFRPLASRMKTHIHEHGVLIQGTIHNDATGSLRLVRKVEIGVSADEAATREDGGSPIEGNPGIHAESGEEVDAFAYDQTDGPDGDAAEEHTIVDLPVQEIQKDDRDID